MLLLCHRSNVQPTDCLSDRTLVIILVISLLIFPPMLKAQAPGLSGVSVSIERISVEQGLSHRSVNAITQDRQGFIWIGTQDGLNRFDGQNFTIYRNNPSDSTSLSNSCIWSLYEDKTGTIWVGTQNGLNSFDHSTNTWTKYFHDPSTTSSLSNSEIRCMYEDRAGTFWVGTARGLNRFDRNSRTWTRLFPVPEDTTSSGNNFINVVLEDREGCFWVATGCYNIAGGGLCQLDRTSGRSIHFRHDPPNPTSLPNDWVTSLFEDSSGAIWIGTNAGVCTFNRATNTFALHPIPYQGPQSIHRLFIKSICEDRIGVLWIATYGWGILKYDKGSNTFSRFTYDDRDPLSIGSPNVMTLFLDRAGLLWAGTWGGGANTVAMEPFVHVQTLARSHLLKNGATALLEDRRGDLYIGMESNGVWKYSLAKQALLRVPMPLIFNPMTLASTVSGSEARTIRLLREDTEGSIWIGSWNSGELLRYNPAFDSSSTIFRTPNANSGGRELIYSFLLDEDGAFLVASNTRVYNVDKDGSTHSIYTHDVRNTQTMNPGAISTILRDHSGVLWVGTSTGLNRFEKNGRSYTRFTRDVKNRTSLSENTIWSMCEDHLGRLWVGTANGLNRFEPTTGTFTRFSTAEGLAGRFITSIQEDENGDLWFSTEAGISRVNPKTGTVVNYDQSDGLPTAEYSQGCAIRRKNGELLFGTNSGIVAFRPANVKPLEYIPPIVVTGIKKFNEPVNLTTLPELVREIVIEHGEDVFSIEFTALSYEKRQFNQYAYKLDGFNRDWVYCGSRREAIYTNLDPGVYTFQVKGSNHDGVWNEAGTSLTVIINPAYWQTWWFRTLAIVVILGLIGSAYQREVNRLKKEKFIQQEFTRKQMESQEAERKRLASELHDGLGQNLLVVKNELQQFLSEQKGPQDDLNRVVTLVQESVESVREISSNLHPHHIERLGFCAAVEAMTENISHSAGLRIECSCDKLDHQLPKEIEIHLYRIIQEGLSNVVRHASAHNAGVEVRKNPKSIEVTINDDGCGFDIREFQGGQLPGQSIDLGRGFGLASMSERARIVGGTLTIESSVSSGTTIHLTLPQT